MRWCRAAWIRLLTFFAGTRNEGDAAAELDAHVQLHVEESIRLGLSPLEARRQALLQLGGLQPIRERIRDRRGVPILVALGQDLRHAARSLLHAPRFALTVILTLALGIAASTGLFTVINAAVIHPFPYVDADRLARLDVQLPSGSGRPLRITGQQLLDVRRATAVDDAYLVDDGWSMTLTGGSFPESVFFESYSANALTLLGVPALLGRVFEESDTPPGQEPRPVVVLKYGFWQRHFGGSPDAIGRTLRLDRKTYTVIGVLPPQHFPGPYGGDLLLPLSSTFDPGARWRVYIRLKPGVTTIAAESELQGMFQQFTLEAPRRFPQGSRLQVTGLVAEQRSGEFVSALMLVATAAGLLLIIACADVSILLVVRVTGREREIAVRRAIGATRWRLAAIVAGETVILALIGAAIAVVLNDWATPRIAELVPGLPPLRDDETTALSALVFAGALSVAIGLACGLRPALSVSRRDHHRAIDAVSARTAASTGTRTTHGVLIAAQVALAVLLLAGTGAAIRSFLQLYRSDLGYNPNHVLIAQLRLPLGSFPQWADRSAFVQRLRDQIAGAPEVSAASLGIFTAPPPWTLGRPSRVEIDGRAAGDERVPVLCVGADYFATLRMPLLRGRMWATADDRDAAQVAVINETMARRFWRDRDPVGERVRVPDFFAAGSQYVLPVPARGGSLEIIGVVRDTPNRGLRNPAVPAVYVPFTHMLGDEAIFVIRTASGATNAEAGIRAAVRTVDKEMSIVRFLTAESYLAMQGWALESFVAGLMLSFGVLALLFAAVGLASVVSYSVAQRIREFGIRIALGAGRLEVFALALKSSIGATIAGLIAGIVLTAVSSGIAERWSLHDVSDPTTLGAAAATLLFTAVAASVIPARRVMRIQPSVALRSE